MVKTRASDVWPTFVAENGDYRHLVRYVSYPSLVNSGLRSIKAAPAPERDAAARRRMARDLYQLMRGRFRYDNEAFHPGKGQIIRDVHWAMRDAATCVDLVLIFAALCQRDGLYPLVALSPIERPTHAYVAVDVGLDARDAGDKAWRPTQRGPAALPGQWVGRFEDFDPLLWVDVVGCTEDAAFRRVSAPPADGSACLLDVSYLQHQPQFAPYDPRQAISPSPAITRLIPDRGHFHEFADRRGWHKELAKATGVVVLYGEAGSGKSMLAIEVADMAGDRAGWVLRADDACTVTASLAYGEASETGRRLGDVNERLDRDELAAEARRRLAASPLPWVVVADNAEGDPDEIYAALPRPGPGQLLLITTTNPAWQSLVDPANDRWIELDPLPEAQLRKAFPQLDADAIAAAAGTPLLARSFTRFKHAARRSVIEAAGDAAAGSGPQLLWAAISNVASDRRAIWRAGLLAALMPPDRIDPVVLDRVAAAPGAAEELCRLGFLHSALDDARIEDDSGARTALFLHRTFGEAVLNAASAKTAADVPTWCTDPEFISLIDGWGSTAGVMRMAWLLAAWAGAVKSMAFPDASQKAVAAVELLATRLQAGGPPPRATFGAAAVRVAGLVELFGHTDVSGNLYKHSLVWLDDTEPGHWPLLGEARHGVARRTNQAGESDVTEDDIVGAVQMAAEAQAMRRRYAARVGTVDAKALVYASNGLRLLLLSRLAKMRGDIAGMRAAVEGLEENALVQVGLLGPNSLLAVRSVFNPCGRWNDLAVKIEDNEERRTLFARAAAGYLDVLERRVRLYRRSDHVHIAACLHGVAIVNFNEAVYCDSSAAEKLALLETAEDYALRGLEMRQRVGASVTDMVKSHTLLVRIYDAITEIASAKEATKNRDQWSKELEALRAHVVV